MTDACPRDADPRPSRVRPPPFSHPEREGPPPAVPRIDGERRADVAGPPHARAAQEIAVVLRDLEQLLRRIGPAVDPMRASREREVAVRIDHPRDDRRSSGVDDAHIPREGAFVGRRADPHNPAVADEDADPFPQGRSRTVCESRVAIHDGSIRGHRATGCAVGSRRVRSFRPRWSRGSNGEDWDAFRMAGLAHGNEAPQKREKGSEEPFLRSFVQLYPSSRKNPMQRLYAGTWMRNRDGSRGGARLEYPRP